MKVAIILTGTVKIGVKGGNFSQEERFQMYTRTLQFYADTIGKEYPIVFVENSDADLSEWKKRFENRLNLTIYQFRPGTNDFDGFDNSKGKGFNEYLMIKKGIERMAEDPELENVTHFLKITGRYSMLNIRNILTEVEKTLGKRDLVFMGDVKDTRIYEMMGRGKIAGHWGDSRFFAADLRYYRENLSDCYKEMNDYMADRWAEHYLLRLSRQYRRDPRFQFRFRTQVRFDGVSGATGGKHNTVANRAKAGMRQALRYMLPCVWF